MVAYDVRDLIERAFVAAKAKRGGDWRRMSLAELKTRMLELSNRTFKESDHGVTSFKAFVEKMSDVVSLDLTGATHVAELKQRAAPSTMKEAAPVPAKADPEVGAESTLDHYRSKGDRLAVGEMIAGNLGNTSAAALDAALATVISNWASTAATSPLFHSTRELATQADQFLPNNLAAALVHVVVRMRRANREGGKDFTDLAYKCSKHIDAAFGNTTRGGSSDALKAAAAKLDESLSSLKQAVTTFKRSTTVTAKQHSLDVVRSAHRYFDFALPGEKHVLRELDVLLGPLFRKFCEACERHELTVIPKRATELRRHIQRLQESYRSDTPYDIWLSVLLPALQHVASLVEDGTRGTAELTAPSLSIVGGTFKLDLSAAGRTITFPARLRNTGQGTAFAVTFTAPQLPQGTIIALAEPSSPFDLPAGGERLVTLALITESKPSSLELAVTWVCTTAIGKTCEFPQALSFAQQTVEPDWDAFRARPPYAINPIRDRKDLFGRDNILSNLAMSAAGGVSTFLWGQKRVGKTSVLQVLAAELSEQPGTTCIVLRMGELASLHEGQIAHTIATRLLERCTSVVERPAEEHFGAGLGRLVPFVERLAQKNPNNRFVVIIDEFDDLDTAFYTGERGRQFVKALRSLSEVGLTLFFVGSERMDAIYRAHSSDLNKWVNVSLDRLRSDDDCAALITRPVVGAIEFHPESVRWISRYCGGNPFYMHLLCNALFRRCCQEHRTYVGESDVEDVHKEMLGTLGPTNFAHLWEDNPELRPGEKQRQTAENALFLACCAALGGTYDDVDDVMEAQASLKLPAAQQLTTSRLKEVEGRLTRRGVLANLRPTQTIELPIFRDWLIANADAHLVPIWRRHAEDQSTAANAAEGTQFEMHIEPAIFPIPEDDLLPVSEKLVYLGKQKDVAEVRRWLRQFDDDSRIEVAFLLLRRLAERGFMNEGTSISGLSRMQEAIQARRLQVGGRTWSIVRGQRIDNLCVSFVDSETKSGAATARELAKRMRPGKCAPLVEIQPWITSHLDSDPMLVIADDFAGTGSTIIEGLTRLRELNPTGLRRLQNEGRILCCIQQAFPEALTNIKAAHSNVAVLSMETFGDEVRALDEDAKIFASEGELRFAREALLQIGRQLWPQHPLGFGDFGALVAFHNTIPNNTLPIFWGNGTVNDRQWLPLLPRASYS